MCCRLALPCFSARGWLARLSTRLVPPSTPTFVNSSSAGKFLFDLHHLPRVLACEAIAFDLIHSHIIFEAKKRSQPLRDLRKRPVVPKFDFRALIPPRATGH